MLSVVIPQNNKEKSITNTIQSVLDQTLQDFDSLNIDECVDKDIEWDRVNEILEKEREMAIIFLEEELKTTV